jgi:protein-S-isoprenylcysteine O-methyltransferase Ste14
MARRLPFRWDLAALGLVLYGLAVVVEIQCRRHLKLRTLMGVPQLLGERDRLLTEGIYSRTRNPRYLGVILGVGGWTLILNYPALYVAGLVSLPALYWLIRFEERELAERFGEGYRRYKRRVPRLIPRLRLGPDRER